MSYFLWHITALVSLGAQGPRRASFDAQVRRNALSTPGIIPFTPVTSPFEKAPAVGTGLNSP